MGSNSETGAYRKELGFWTIVLLTVGAILGPAIAFVPVTVLGLAGPAGIVAWVIALAMIIPVAMVYVELGTMWPRAGGVAYYPARSHGPVAGVLNAWAAFVGYSLAMPAVVAAIVEYASYFYPPLYANGTLTPLGLAVSVVATIIIWLINIRRVGFMGTVNNVLTAIKTILILAVCFVLLAYFHPSNFTAYGGFVPYGVGGIFLATSATIFAYDGFRHPIVFAEEVKEPGNTIPKAVLASLFIVFAVYLIESLAFLGVLNWSSLGLNPNSWPDLTNLPYPYASASLSVGLPLLALLAILAIVIASFSDGVVYYGGAARVGHALAQYDGYFPASLSKLNRVGIPFNATLVVLIISLVYLILLPSFASVLSIFVDAVVFSYAPGAVSLLVFRKRDPSEPRPYLLPAAKVLAPFSFVVGGLLIFWTGWRAVLISLTSVFVGLVLLTFFNRRRKINSEDLKAGIWLPLYAVSVMILSYLSDTKYFGGTGVLPFPWDNIVFVAVSLAFFYWGYAAGIRYRGKGTLEA